MSKTSGDGRVALPEFELLTTVDQLKVLAHEVRLRMLRELRDAPATGSDLARRLSLPAARAHYHLGQLREAGLVRQLKEKPRRSTKETPYVVSARHFLVDPELTGVGEVTSRGLVEATESAIQSQRREDVLGIRYSDLADRIVDALPILHGAVVLIVINPNTLTLGEELSVALRAAGARPRPFLWSRSTIFSTLDRHDEKWLATAPLLPERDDAEIDACVLITSSRVQGAPPSEEQRVKLPHLLEAVAAWQRGLRDRRVPHLEVALPHSGEFAGGEQPAESALDDFWRSLLTPPAELRSAGEAIARDLREQRTLTIHGARTELVFDHDPSLLVIQDGCIDHNDVERGFTSEALPAGTLVLLPTEGGAHGSFHADFTFMAGQHYGDVELEIVDGELTQFRVARGDTTALERQFESATGRARTLASISVGLNPRASAALSGKPSFDASRPGMITLTFGNNELFGGSVSSTFTIHFPARGLQIGPAGRSWSISRRGGPATPARPKR